MINFPALPLSVQPNPCFAQPLFKYISGFCFHGRTLIHHPSDHLGSPDQLSALLLTEHPFTPLL